MKVKKGKSKLAVQNVYIFDAVNYAWTLIFLNDKKMPVVFRWQT